MIKKVLLTIFIPIAIMKINDFVKRFFNLSFNKSTNIFRQSLERSWQKNFSLFKKSKN